MAGEDDPNIYEEDEDESEELEEEEEEDEEITGRVEEDEEEEDLNSHSPSTSSSSQENPKNPNPLSLDPKPSVSPSVAVALAASAPPQNGSVSDPLPAATTPAGGSSFSPDRKRLRTVEKPSPAVDDSRRLFQRLWTDEDEIGLLQGFLDYISQRDPSNSSSHLDKGPFYDQIKDRLQLDFNKNQLVEKLRRLKKKYRNVVSRISSGKDFSFKSPHDQTTFEISRKIWSGTSVRLGSGVEEGGFEEEEGNLQNNTNTPNVNHANSSEKKVSRSRKRSRKRSAEVAEEDLSNFPPPPPPPPAVPSSVPNVIEDTVRSCLSPLFKELLYCAINGPCNSGIGGIGGVALNPLPLNFGGNSVNLSSSEAVDQRWKKQQILELEVYSKRLELVQEQIKSTLEELKSGT
ncbi:putative transcription factor At3g04930 [Tasmannia lanceolata]|uniref:putative transcription factor At3g04930 n=1 Tax=Tasmannia lanceolata TaxID=3420 RepID=UPI004062EE1F